MPEYDELPEVARAAARASIPPPFDELRSRGVRRRRRRTSAYAALAAVAVVGAAGVTGSLGDRGAEPDPAPAPQDQPTQLEFTRADGTRFVSGSATLECVEADTGETVLHVLGAGREAGPVTGADGAVALEVPLEEALSGARVELPTGDGTSLVATDGHGTELSSSDTRSSGELRIVSASCGERPLLAFTVDGVLAGEDPGTPTVRVAGGMVVRGEPDVPEDPEPDPRARAEAEAIITGEHARLVDVAVSPDDPDVRAAVWQDCAPPPGDCRSRYALALTDDDFRTRAVATRVFTEQAWLSVDGRYFHVVSGSPSPGWVYDTEGRERPVRTGPVPEDGHGPVVDIRNGLAVPVVVDLAAATMQRIRLDEPLPGSARIDRRPDGGLIAYDGEKGKTVVSLSEDNGRTWRGVEVDAADGAFLDVLPRADGGPLILVEGAVVGEDGHTSVAVHELREGGAVRTEVPGGMSFSAPQLVTRDGRLVALVDGMGAPRAEYGFHASAPGDWGRLERFTAGSPYHDDSGRVIDARVLHVDEATGRMVLSEPFGGDTGAYSSTDGGLTWTPFLAR